MSDKVTVLTDLDFLKTQALMLSSYMDAEHYADEFFEGMKGSIQKPRNLEDLKKEILQIANVFRDLIPENVREEWQYSDYEVYTDKFYHRMYWNEIPNPNAVNFYFEVFCELIKMPDSAEAGFSLSIYDLDEDIFFKTEDDLNKFVEEYELNACTAFEEHAESREELWCI